MTVLHPAFPTHHDLRLDRDYSSNTAVAVAFTDGLDDLTEDVGVNNTVGTELQTILVEPAVTRDLRYST